MTVKRERYTSKKKREIVSNKIGGREREIAIKTEKAKKDGEEKGGKVYA